MNLYHELTLRPPQQRTRGTIVPGCSLGESLSPRRPINAKKNANGVTRRVIAQYISGRSDVSTDELAERFDLHPTSVVRVLNQLRDEGLVYMTGAGGRQRWHSSGG